MYGPVSGPFEGPWVIKTSLTLKSKCTHPNVTLEIYTKAFVIYGRTLYKVLYQNEVAL